MPPPPRIRRSWAPRGARCAARGSSTSTTCWPATRCPISTASTGSSASAAPSRSREIGRYPYARSEEAELLRAAVERELPVLGVCLGAQLLAHALGGSVRRLPRRAVRWVELDARSPTIELAAGPASAPCTGTRTRSSRRPAPSSCSTAAASAARRSGRERVGRAVPRRRRRRRARRLVRALRRLAGRRRAPTSADRPRGRRRAPPRPGGRPPRRSSAASSDALEQREPVRRGELGDLRARATARAARRSSTSRHAPASSSGSCERRRPGGERTGTTTSTSPSPRANAHDVLARLDRRVGAGERLRPPRAQRERARDQQQLRVDVLAAARSAASAVAPRVPVDRAAVVGVDEREQRQLVAVVDVGQARHGELEQQLAERGALAGARRPRPRTGRSRRGTPAARSARARTP